MKELTFVSFGVSYEDFEVFKDSGLLKDFQYKMHVVDNYQNVSSEMTIALSDLNKYADNHFEYLESQEYKDAVDEFKKVVDNKKGLFFNWSVEYDYNLMFIENVSTEEELVDILEKLKQEWLDSENDE